MTPPVLFEPAAAIAAGLCLTARSVDAKRRTERHPRPCGWCDWPAEQLRAMVEGYNAWAGYDERRGTYARHEARVFQDLNRAEQAALVLEAQSFPPVVDPVDQPTQPPADAAVEGPSWMPQP